MYEPGLGLLDLEVLDTEQCRNIVSYVLYELLTVSNRPVSTATPAVSSRRTIVRSVPLFLVASLGDEDHPDFGTDAAPSAGSYAVSAWRELYQLRCSFPLVRRESRHPAFQARNPHPLLGQELR